MFNKMKHLNSLIILSIILSIFCFNIENVEGIIGGDDTPTGNKKYMVSIQNDRGHVCGGVIIGETTILSAASCFIDVNEVFKTDQFSIVAGTNNLRNKEEPRVLVIDVAKVYVPKEYKRQNPLSRDLAYLSTGDMAVLKLKMRLRLRENSEFITKMMLPTINPRKHFMYVNENPTVSGYGIASLSIFNRDSNIETIVPNHCSQLKSAKTYVFLNRSCQRILNMNIDSKHLCARVNQRNLAVYEGVCYGDIGSPLIREFDLNVIGILSRPAIDCNEKDNGPAVYTRVSYFVSFIEDAMRNVFKSSTMRMAEYRTITLPGSTQQTAQLLETFQFI